MDSTGNTPSGEIWRHDQVFNAPRAYDLAFGWSVAGELRALARVLDLQTSASVLIPACGTGRYATRLAELGHRIDAFDVNEAMIAFAKEHNAHPGIRYRVADMTRRLRWQRAEFQGAFLFCNSFRYMLADHEASNHLLEMRRVIVPRGFYVVELDLNLVAAHRGLCNAWRASVDDVEVEARWTLESLEPPHATERVELTLREANAETTFREYQPQRVWTTQELSVLARDTGWHVDGFFDGEGARVRDPYAPGRYYVGLVAAGGSP